MSAISPDLLALIARTASDFIAEPGHALDATINRTLAAIGTLFDADRTYLFQQGPAPGLICNTHEWCADGVEPQIGHLQALPESLFPWWMEQMHAGRAINLTCLEDLPPEASRERELLQAQGIHSLLVLPLVRRGQLEGFAGFDHVRGTRRWSDQEVAVLRIVVSSIAQGFERRLTDERLERMAYEDPLTGLPNRAMLGRRLAEALERARGSGRLLAVGYLDLDAFKQVNDSHGHAVGDALLVVMAARLRESLRPGDTVGRLGGDEFVVVLPELESRGQLLRIGRALLERIAEPCPVGDGITVAISTSLGFRVVPPDDADPDLLLRQADQAMYAAKRAGRNRIHLFDDRLERRELQRSQAIHAIRRAITHGELRLFVQPMVDLASGAVTCVEALVRWQHPERGLLAPDRWLPLIIDQPEIAELGQWVIATALTQASAWRRSGLAIGISVNVSARELQDPRFVQRLAALLARHRALPPSSLRLEVVETAAIDDPQRALETMQRCCALGVGFALDDFGTGYSPLTHLRELPVSTLKVDRSFVRNMLDHAGDRVIVRSVIELAHAFDRLCVAEGVENDDQLTLLRELGCDWVQGYGLARPMPAGAFEDWLRRSQRPWPGTATA